jgi:hypothetical protein
MVNKNILAHFDLSCSRYLSRCLEELMEAQLLEELMEAQLLEELMEAELLEEPEGSLPCSNSTAIGLCSILDEYNPSPSHDVSYLLVLSFDLRPDA